MVKKEATEPMAGYRMRMIINDYGLGEKMGIVAENDRVDASKYIRCDSYIKAHPVGNIKMPAGRNCTITRCEPDAAGSCQRDTQKKPFVKFRNGKFDMVRPFSDLTKEEKNALGY